MTLREISAKLRGEDADRPATLAALFALGAGNPSDAFDVSHECLALLSRGKLKADELAPYAPTLIAQWDSAFQELVPLQLESASTEWLFDEEYIGARAQGESVLDLLGYLDGDEVGTRLRQGVTLIDPRMKAFAILSLLRRGESVDAAEIEHVAASLEMRMTFWRVLKQLGRESLMPERWAKAEELAASDLAVWASHPNELGASPEEVELMRVVTVESEDGNPEAVYLFRFREYPKPWEDGEGWMAGIAGPIRNGLRQDSPWSSFQKWNSMTAEEHFDKLYYRNSACVVQ